VFAKAIYHTLHIDSVHAAAAAASQAAVYGSDRL